MSSDRQQLQGLLHFRRAPRLFLLPAHSGLGLVPYVFVVDTTQVLHSRCTLCPPLSVQGSNL